MTQIFNLQFDGRGSEKQKAWAAQIFNTDMQDLIKSYDEAKIRVADKSMPESWLSAWDAVLSNPKYISAWVRYSSMDAGDIIDYKGFKSAKGSMSLVEFANKMAAQTYNS